MPLMTKIRENMTKTFAVFAGVFVIYIVLDWGMDLSGRKRASQTAEAQEIGIVNGHRILVKDFSELVRQASENQKQQTGTDPDENTLRMIRDQVWNQLVEENLFADEIERLGIAITDQEIVDWVRGDNPPAFLKQQFTDSTGTFNRSAYESAMNNPQNATIWLKVEDYLRKARLREKLQSVIASGTRVSDGEILQRFMDQNIKYEAECILFDPSLLVKDDEVSVTDADLKKEYDDNADEFKQEPTRKLKYVKFDVKPSSGDTAAVMNDLADIQKRAKEGADFIEIAKTYSETPINDSLFFKHGELNPEREKAVFSGAVGDLIGPTNEADGYHLVKILEFKEGAEEYVRASHILISVDGNDSAGALKLAKEVFAKAKSGSDFGVLAMQYSKDGSASQGGDVGWFGKNKMVKPFEEASFKAKVGQIVGPVKTQFGYHITKLTGRDKQEVRFADIHMQIRVSAATTEDINQLAQDFMFAIKEDGGEFTTVATENKYPILEVAPFEKDAFIPGIGMHTGINKFAFNGKVGDVSDVYTLPNGGYGVFTITEVRNAGLKPFEEVRTTLDPRVKRLKKMEKVKAMVADVYKQFAPTDSLSKISTIKPGMAAQELRGFNLSGFIPNIGRDLKFSGALANMAPGQMATVEGSRGWFIVKLFSKSQFDSAAFNAQKNNLRTQMLSERRNTLITDWSTKLKKSADIVDNRDRFYR